jgi:2-oxoisovalerate dehydrogenase E1 component
LDIELIDLRTLAPLDYDTIYQSVQKTGKAMIVHEDNLTGGLGGEISARITENCFQHLDAPVMRCASLDTPIPFSAQLEWNYLANKNLLEKLNSLLAY